MKLHSSCLFAFRSNLRSSNNPIFYVKGNIRLCSLRCHLKLHCPLQLSFAVIFVSFKPTSFSSSSNQNGERRLVRILSQKSFYVSLTFRLLLVILLWPSYIVTQVSTPRPPSPYIREVIYEQPLGHLSDLYALKRFTYMH